MVKLDWISAKERLPQDDKLYLVITENLSVFALARYRKETEREVAHWESGGLNYNERKSISHWMPLPEPPEGEK